MSDRYGRIIGKVERHFTIWSIRTTDISSLWKITKTYKYKQKVGTFTAWNMASIDKTIDYIYEGLEMDPNKMTDVSNYKDMPDLQSDCKDENVRKDIVIKINKSILFLKSLTEEELTELVEDSRWTDILCIFGIIEGYGLICGETREDVIQKLETSILEHDWDYLRILSKESNLLNTLLIKTDNGHSIRAITIFDKEVYIKEPYMW